MLCCIYVSVCIGGQKKSVMYCSMSASFSPFENKKDSHLSEDQIEERPSEPAIWITQRREGLSHKSSSVTDFELPQLLFVTAIISWWMSHMAFEIGLARLPLNSSPCLSFLWCRNWYVLGLHYSYALRVIRRSKDIIKSWQIIKTFCLWMTSQSLRL